MLRVTQLDAVIMDLELFEMLKAQFFKSFAFFRVRSPHSALVSPLLPITTCLLTSLVHSSARFQGQMAARAGNAPQSSPV